MAVRGAKWALGAASLGAAAVGVWVISPRFSLRGPSLIDDWNSIHTTPKQVSSLGRLFTTSDVNFRPASVAWTYVQWHTLGAPGDMTGPNVWNVLRLLVFFAGVALFTFLLLRFAVPEGSELTAAVLAALAPLIVMAMPGVAVEFARLAPAEPLLIGGLALGGSLLLLGVRELAGARRAGRTVAYIVAGLLLWAVGVYHKEISTCVLILVPFAYLAARTRLRPLVSRLGRRGRVELVVLGAVVLAPVLHTAVAVAVITHRGKLPYGTQVGFGSGSFHETVTSFRMMQSITGSYLGWFLFAAVALQVAVSIVRRRPDWLLSGLLVTALACLAWNAQTGEHPARYYIPSFTLLAAGLALMLLRFSRRSGTHAIAAVAIGAGLVADQLRRWSSHPGALLSDYAIVLFALAAAGLGVLLVRRARPAGLVAVAALCVLAGGSAARAHVLVGQWEQDDARGVSLVRAVNLARASGCSVAETGLDMERAIALPILSEPKAAGLPCAGSRAFLVVGAQPSAKVLAACRHRTELGVFVTGYVATRLLRCDDLSPADMKLFDRLRMG